jgi:predicted metal-binding membrane protein
MLRTHPEGLALGLGIVAWGWMLSEAIGAPRRLCCGSAASPGEDVVAWMLMVIAMMVPTTTSNLRDIAGRSYRVRRLRAVIGYLTGYLAWWTMLGVTVVGLHTFWPACNARIATLLCAFGAVWALIPARQRWFRSCHRRIPLCPLGWRADRDAFRQGAAHGAPCVAACWPLMVACAVTGHNVVMMVACTTLAVFEKRMFRLEREPLAIGALLLGAWTLAL